MLVEKLKKNYTVLRITYSTGGKKNSILEERITAYWRKEEQPTEGSRQHISVKKNSILKEGGQHIREKKNSILKEGEQHTEVRRTAY